MVSLSCTSLGRYGYGRASNRTWRKNPTDPSEQYDWLHQYDGLQRLKNAERGTLNGTHTAITSPQFGQCWSLDATGNWENFRQADEGSSWTLEQTRSANPVNEITGINNTLGQPWAQPTYDANGNMTTIPHPTGQQPFPSSSSSSSSEPDPSAFTATYDAWNRLLKLVDSETEETVQENHYDGRNFRITRSDYVDGDLDQTRHFYYTDDWRCVEERLDASTTPDRHFIWGLRYIDDLICRDRSTIETLNERLYALPDGNWNVTALVNTSGAVVERLEYDPYGNTTWLTAGFAGEDGSQFAWEVTYCSYRWDDTASMFHVRFRWYIPSLGMWSTRDPASYIEGTNLYVVAWSSPMGNTDPFGLAVGHHYFPQSLLGLFFSQGLLSKGAFDLGMGYFYGGTNPSHRYGTYGGVTHKQYNDDVSEAFIKYLKGKGKKQANQSDLMDFIDTHLRGGDPVEGMDMCRCSSFNSAVDKTVVNKKGSASHRCKVTKGLG